MFYRILSISSIPLPCPKCNRNFGGAARIGSTLMGAFEALVKKVVKKVLTK